MRAVFLVPAWYKALKREQMPCFWGDPVTVCTRCLRPCLERIVSPWSVTKGPVCTHGQKENKSCAANKRGAWRVSLRHPGHAGPAETVSSNVLTADLPPPLSEKGEAAFPWLHYPLQTKTKAWHRCPKAGQAEGAELALSLLTAGSVISEWGHSSSSVPPASGAEAFKDF